MIETFQRIRSIEFNSSLIIKPLWGFGSTLAKVAKWGYSKIPVFGRAAPGLSEKELIPLREPLHAFPKNFEYYVHPGNMMTKLGSHSIRLLNGPVDLDHCTKLAIEAEGQIEAQDPGGLQKMIEEDTESRLWIQFDGYNFNFGEDPKELENHRKALSFIEENVLKNPTFFKQSAAGILELICVTHQLLATGTRALYSKKGGEFRSVNMYIRRLGFDEKFEHFNPSIKREFQIIRNKEYWSEEDQEFLRRLGLFIPILGKENIEAAMMELASTIQKQAPLILTGEVDPIEFAAYVHYEITRIHAFYDEHGRLARLWMNALLGIGGIKPVYFPSDEAYTNAIERGAETFTEYLKSLIHPGLSLSN